jgi:hypothetical protein
MANNSVQKLRGAPVCPLGFIQVTASGTPVQLSAVIDPSGNNAPATLSFQNAAGQTEWTPACRGFSIYGYQPNSNNHGPAYIPNAGNIYLVSRPSPGGAGNRSDTGCLIAIIPPAQVFFYPPEYSPDMFSPYDLRLDADNNNDGGMVVAWGGGNP